MRVVVRRKHLILFFCLAATLTSLALTYFVTERYQSYTTLLYPAQQPLGLGAQQRVVSPYYTVLYVPSDSIARTLETVLRSEAVVQQVVRILELDRGAGDSQAGLFGDWGGGLGSGSATAPDRFLQTVRGLQDNLLVEPSQEGFSFRLQALDKDPGQAAAIVDTVARVLIDHLKREQVRSTHHEREKIEIRLKENLEEITEARVDLERFKKKARIASLSEQVSSKEPWRNKRKQSRKRWTFPLRSDSKGWESIGKGAPADGGSRVAGRQEGAASLPGSSCREAESNPEEIRRDPSASK